MLGNASTARSRVLEVVFSLYDPQHIGIIDYHGPNRNFAREQIGGINLSIDSHDQRLRQHALYNSTNKYANLKSEMAAGYVHHLLAREANAALPADDRLTDTLKELFSTFFPGKQFLGPQPTDGGRLLFPVMTPNGAQHDIDELSSGEKEVLYGYLRLRNAAPRNSVLLIDEPELHLNPRLISGLASFYHRHLGRELGSQLWLVTHSDTLIREAVGQKDFAVYHMHPPGGAETSNQAVPVRATEDLDRVVIDLVGDLAAYRPGAKLVIFEGGSDSEFDVRMTSRLFPEFARAVNAISGGDKRRVGGLHDVLETARQAGYLAMKVYSVTDNDREMAASATGSTQLQWDLYHIENYLMEAAFIRKVLKEINMLPAALDSDEPIMASLKACAAETIHDLVAHRLRTLASTTITEGINFGFDPLAQDIGAAMSDAIERCHRRMGKVMQSDLRRDLIVSLSAKFTTETRAELDSGEWVKTFRGREILRRFAGKHARGLLYENLRDLIIARMRDADHRPAGMKLIVDRILNDPW